MRIFDFFKKRKEEKTPYDPFEIVKTEKGDYNKFYNRLLKIALQKTKSRSMRIFQAE
jgi:hypothetical protein